MAAVRPRVELIRELYESIGVRHTERWRTEAEDEIVRLVADLSFELPQRKIRLLKQLLVWVVTHARGESRTSLAAMCLDEEETGGAK